MTSPEAGFARVTVLFDEALAMPPAEREAFLDRACGSDLRLKADVLALVDADARAGAFLSPAGTDVKALLLGDSGGVRFPGTMLGAYRIVRALGSGGMGTVYLADDTRLDRPVTLKVLHEGDGAGADATRQERLRFEARAAAGLAHPNVATVYALEDIDGELCLVGEYVPGVTARALLDQGPVDPATVLRVARDVARALAAAHARDIVHRDLKPENILVGDDGIARVLDFGIARALAAPPDAPRLTDTGVVIGTPGYISPEQLEGAAGDARSDLFSFGIVLYELMTGANPFQGPTPASTAARILTLDPPRPRRVDSLFPPALDAVVIRCLRKDPATRYPSASAVLADLDRLASAPTPGPSGAAASAAVDTADPAPEASPGSVASARAWWRTHQWAVVVVVAALAIGNWWIASWVGRRGLLFPLVLALAVADGTLRVHLLFVERHGLAALARQLARTRPWLRVIELLTGLAVAGPASMVLSSHPAVGIAMLAVSAAMVVTGWAVEPVTTQAAFSGDQIAGEQRRAD